ncbi:MAG TPA: sel1 repeat family protein, partial [Pseudomonas sp.]
MSHILQRRETVTPEQLAEDPRQAARWILAAAEAGEPEGQALLGQILLDGRG